MGENGHGHGEAGRGPIVGQPDCARPMIRDGNGAAS